MSLKWLSDFMIGVVVYPSEVPSSSVHSYTISVAAVFSLHYSNPQVRRYKGKTKRILTIRKLNSLSVS